MKNLILALTLAVSFCTLGYSDTIEQRKTIIRSPGLFRPYWSEKVIIERRYIPLPRYRELPRLPIYLKCQCWY